MTKLILANFTHVLPLAILQLSFVSLAIFLMKLVRLIELDPIGFSIVKQHLPASAMFLLVVCASNSVLVLSDLNTLIFVLCTAPLLYSAMDMVVQTLVSGTTAPMTSALSVCCWRSGLALLTLSIGVTMFVVGNSSVVVAGSSWIIIYYVCSVVHRILNNNVLDDLQLSPWSIVFYNNSLALLAVPVAVFCAGEWDDVFRSQTYADIFHVDSMRPLSFCFLISLGPVFFEMNVRKFPMTPTVDMLFAAFCKVCAVSLGVIFLPDHVTITGVLSLFLVIFSVVGLDISRQNRVSSGSTTDNNDVTQEDENVHAPQRATSEDPHHYAATTDSGQLPERAHHDLATRFGICNSVFVFVAVVTWIHSMVVPPAHKNQIVFSPSPLDPNMAAINCSVPVFDPANYQLSLWQSSKDITNLAPAIENNRKFLPENTSFNALSDHDMYLRILDLSTKLEKCGDIYGVAQAFIDLRPMAFRADLYRACQLWDTGGLWLDDKIWLTQSFSSFVDIEKDLVVLPMAPSTMDLV